MRRLMTMGLYLLQAGQVWAQIRVPAQDGRGETLVPAATLEMAIRQQQIVIYLLVVVVLACIAAVAWLGVLYLRMQFSLERVAEAVRRVDLLSEAYRSVSLEWERGMRPGKAADMESGTRADWTAPPASQIVDLGQEMPIIPVAARGARGG